MVLCNFLQGFTRMGEKGPHLPTPVAARIIHIIRSGYRKEIWVGRFSFLYFGESPPNGFL